MADQFGVWREEKGADRGRQKATRVEVEVAFGVVVEDMVGCLKFNSFLKLHKQRIRMGTREVNSASEYFNLQSFVQLKEVSVLFKYFTCHN